MMELCFSGLAAEYVSRENSRIGVHAPAVSRQKGAAYVIDCPIDAEQVVVLSTSSDTYAKSQIARPE